MIRTTTYAGKALFTVRRLAPITGNPPWADLNIDSNGILRKEETRGAGLYAIHHRERLVYLGQFRGTKENAIAGDVCQTRWAKHIGTLTLRDRRISLGLTALKALSEVTPLVPPLADLLAAAEHQAIASHRGRVSSTNRVLFAAENWALFSALEDPAGLADFTICYAQIQAVDSVSNDELRRAIEVAERATIARLRPRCNAEIQVGTALEIGVLEVQRVMEQSLRAALEECLSVVRPPIPGSIGTGPLTVERSTCAERRCDEGDHAPDTGCVEADDKQPETAEERFYAQIQACPDALAAVHQLVAVFDDRSDAYIQYTHTGSGDLRIRTTAGRRQFFNVARIFWQPNLGRFSAEVDLSDQKCMELGATTAVPNYQKKRLPTRATFSMPGAAQGLIKCLNEAALSVPHRAILQ